MTRLGLRLAVAVALIATGYIHLELYMRGYESIRFVGPSFVVMSAGCFATAALLLVGGALVIRLCAAALAVGALVGFVASRTVGLFGFVERGLQPSPEAVLSLVAEVAVLALLALDLVLARRAGPTSPARAAQARATNQA